MLYLPLLLIYLAFLGGLICRDWRLMFRPIVFFSIIYFIRVAIGASYLDNESFRHINIEFDWFKLAACAFPLPLILFAYLNKSGNQFVIERLSSFPRWKEVRLNGSCRIELLVFAAGVGIFLIGGLWLLAVVPFNQLGIYAIFFDPDNALLAREASNKLLTNKVLKLLVTMNEWLVAPLLGMILYMMRLRGVLFGAKLLGLTVVFVLCSPSGARAPFFYLLLTLGLVFLTSEEGRSKWVKFGMIFVGAVVAVSVLTIARHGDLLDFRLERALQILESVIYRLFEVPFYTGFWTNVYASQHGYFGFENIGFPGKGLIGLPHVPLPNLVGLYVFPDSIETAWMNTGMLFSFQASFGIAGGWIVAVVMLLLVERFMFTLKGLHGPIALIAYVLFLRTWLDLLETDFTTVFFGQIFRVVVVVLLIRCFFRRDLERRRLSRLSPTASANA